jgi:hypothetical protein
LNEVRGWRFSKTFKLWPSPLHALALAWRHASRCAFKWRHGRYLQRWKHIWWHQDTLIHEAEHKQWLFDHALRVAILQFHNVNVPGVPKSISIFHIERLAQRPQQLDNTIKQLTGEEEIQFVPCAYGSTSSTSDCPQPRRFRTKICGQLQSGSRQRGSCAIPSFWYGFFHIDDSVLKYAGQTWDRLPGSWDRWPSGICTSPAALESDVRDNNVSAYPGDIFEEDIDTGLSEKSVRQSAGWDPSNC